MTSKNQISKIYQEKIKKFNKFNKSYFEKDNPLISDYEFDKLKKELINLEKTYPFLKSPKGGGRITIALPVISETKESICIL